MTVASKLITKASGLTEPFEPKKLYDSLWRTGASDGLIAQIIRHIESELADGMSTSQIYKHALFLLQKSEQKAAIKYSLRRAVMDLGPSGFPFEKFIGEIFKEKGYKVEVGKIVRGECVEHEIDVIAYNENKLIMAEAKFHNEFGLKSDLKVALYVKARIDDLMPVTFNFGNSRKLDEGWLITNTKFTTSAITYGICKGLKMVGWNYPPNGNLEDLIEDSNLHPITCLTTLTKHQITALLGAGIVRCKDILVKLEILKKDFNMNEKEIQNVVNEIKLF